MFCEYCGTEIEGTPFIINDTIPLHQPRDYPFHNVDCWSRWSTEEDGEDGT